MLKFGGSSCLIGDPERRYTLLEKVCQRVGGFLTLYNKKARKNHWKVPPRRNFFKVAKSTLTECFVLAIWQVMIDHYHTRTNFIVK